MLITDDYRALNKELHKTGDYGVLGGRLAPSVLGLCEQMGTRDILDYGCGQRLLEKALGFDIKNYDPAIEGLEAPPEPADLVVCGDVLEHIEPEMLDAVLDDLRRVTRRTGLFVINTGPAKKILADGRNAHLIQASWRWWSPKIVERFDLLKMEKMGHDIWLIVHKDNHLNGERYE